MLRYSCLLALLLLGGCATFSQDGGFSSVESLTRDRAKGDLSWIRSDAEADKARSRVAALLKEPLTADDAVQVALLNNPGLQASYAELGLAETALVQAGRLPNPRLSYLRATHGDEIKTETVLGFNVLSLLIMPVAARVEGRRFEQAKYAVAAEALRTAAETRRAYFEALAAAESARYQEQVRDSAEASAELARRMVQAGNLSRLAHMREQAFYAEATAQLARARLAAVAGRERLARLLGLTTNGLNLKLPQRLPDLPAAPREEQDAESLALDKRLDLQAARLQTEAVAQNLGLTRATRFINVLELGPARATESPEPRKKGYEIALELPLFDWGGARVARAEAVYMQSVNRVAEMALNARSEVRENYVSYRTAFDLAKHYRDEVVPLRKSISEETLFRYNGMLASVFELLSDSREQVASVNAYIETLRNFWVAEANLQMALTGASPGAMPAAGETSSAPPSSRAAGH
jgi:outer membrane protein TolC